MKSTFLKTVLTASIVIVAITFYPNPIEYLKRLLGNRMPNSGTPIVMVDYRE